MVLLGLKGIHFVIQVLEGAWLLSNCLLEVFQQQLDGFHLLFILLFVHAEVYKFIHALCALVRFLAPQQGRSVSSQLLGVNLVPEVNQW